MGKAKAPKPPDYIGAANATAAGNLEAARSATNANRVNQYTPYGSSTWTHDPGDGNPDGGWSQTTTLDPVAQETLDSQMAMSRDYANTARTGFDRVRGLFENPALDQSKLPTRAIDVGQTAQNAILSRLRPQYDQQEEALRQRLANQGITLGSDAYSREMTQQQQGRTDAEMQAALQGISLDQANRTSALQEQAYMQDRPLNLINALRTGAQVQNPQFQQFAQQATTAGPDILKATDMNYQGQVAANNANNAQTSGIVGGLFNAGMSLAGLPGSGGSIMGGVRGLFG